MTLRSGFLMLAAGALLATATPAAAKTVLLPQGVSVTLPEGWRLDGPAEGRPGSDGRRRVHVVCETERCKRTQETCTFLTRQTPVEGADDGERLASLYESPLARYFRIRAVLKSTSRDAEVLSPLQRLRIGERDWYAIETDARHNYKSGLFAETVVDGQYLGAICKTCETGEIRHQAAREMLKSVRPAD